MSQIFVGRKRWMSRNLIVTTVVTALAISSWVGPASIAAENSGQAKQDLVVAIDKWDPSLAPQSAQLFEHLSPMYEPLFNISMSTAGQKLLPGFVQKWSVRDDGKVFWMKVAQGHRPSPGTWAELTAEDVVFMLNDYYRTYKGSYLDGLWSPIGVEAVQTSKYELEVHLKNGGVLPDSVYLNDIPRLATLVVSKEYVQKVGYLAASKYPVGSGPFELVSSGGGTDVYKAKQNYRGAKPSVQSIKFIHVPDSLVRAQLVATGGADIARRVSTSVALQQLKSTKFQSVTQKFDKTYYVQFGGLDRQQSDWAACPWVDPRVRQAMAESINRSLMTTALTGGLGKLAKALNPSGTSSVSQIPYNVSGAKKLLAAAGYPNGFSFQMPEFTVGGVSRAPDEHAAVSSFFSALGLKPETKRIDFNDYWSTWTSHKLPCWIFVWSTPTTPWVSASTYDKFSSGFGTSTAYVDDTSTVLAKAVIAASKAGNVAATTAAQTAAALYLRKVYAVMPLYTGVSINLVRKGSLMTWSNMGHEDTTRYEGLKIKE